ncbi:MAG: hypothetical protein KIT09_25745 [Bryobacteraceae bacterium]|nr:hypothetical protein [Bryobacteraceae bacterium]
MKMSLTALCMAVAACGPLSAADLLAGWASVSITPDKPVALAGQFHTRISKSVHDPVTATALALDNGAEQAVMVSLDVVAVNKELLDRVRTRLKAALPEFDGRKLLLNATHTNTAPEMREGNYEIPEGVMTPTEFVEFLTEKVSAVAVEAWKARRPAGVSWATGHAVIGYNRRAVFADGRSVMYAKLDQPEFMGFEGYEDHALELLFFWTPERKLTGIGINVACPSQVVEGESYISADFWNDARIELRRRYGQDLFVFPMTGAAGDQSPHVQLRKAAEAKMRQRLGATATGQIGRRIAAAVEEVYPAAAADIRMGAPLAHRVEELRLPVRKVTPAEAERAMEEYTRLKQAPATQPNRYAMIRRASAVMERYKRQESVTEFPMELHVIRVGDVALATNPFELFLDFGLRMKARSRAEQTFVVQLACDTAGYLPTAKAVAGGGYGAEIASNKVGPEGGQALVERTVAAINALFE